MEQAKAQQKAMNDVHPGDAPARRAATRPTRSRRPTSCSSPAPSPRQEFDAIKAKALA